MWQLSPSHLCGNLVGAFCNPPGLDWINCCSASIMRQSSCKLSERVFITDTPLLLILTHSEACFHPSRYCWKVVHLRLLFFFFCLSHSFLCFSIYLFFSLLWPPADWVLVVSFQVYSHSGRRMCQNSLKRKYSQFSFHFYSVFKCQPEPHIPQT